MRHRIRRERQTRETAAGASPRPTGRRCDALSRLRRQLPHEGAGTQDTSILTPHPPFGAPSPQGEGMDARDVWARTRFLIRFRKKIRLHKKRKTSLRLLTKQKRRPPQNKKLLIRFHKNKKLRFRPSAETKKLRFRPPQNKNFASAKRKKLRFRKNKNQGRALIAPALVLSCFRVCIVHSPASAFASSHPPCPAARKRRRSRGRPYFVKYPRASFRRAGMSMPWGHWAAQAPHSMHLAAASSSFSSR